MMEVMISQFVLMRGKGVVTLSCDTLTWGTQSAMESAPLNIQREMAPLIFFEFMYFCS